MTNIMMKDPMMDLMINLITDPIMDLMLDLMMEQKHNANKTDGPKQMFFI